VANTYAGGTRADGVTLVVSNATGSATGPGPVTLNASNTPAGLTGTGAVDGAVTVGARNFLAPGGETAPGTLTVRNSVTFASAPAGSKPEFRVRVAGTAGAPLADRLLVVGGAVRLNGAQLALGFSGTPGPADELAILQVTGGGTYDGSRFSDAGGQEILD